MIGVLCIVTAIYLCLASIWDIRERAIYSFPCEMLIVLWGGYLGASKSVSGIFLLIYILVGIFLYFFFRFKKVWGDGDSELLLVFMLVYLAFCKQFGIHEICIELVLLASALFVAILIGYVEAKIKEETVCANSSIAVAPGFAIVTMIWMIRGVMMC